MKLSKVTRAGLVVGLFMASAIAQNPVSAQVSTAGTGPYYATPSWDQKITTGRFVVLTNWNNEAVLDRETGLVWEKEPSTALDDWDGVSRRCFVLDKGGRRGWRLPTVQDLSSLIDSTQSFPPLPAGHPFTNLQASFYWSATSVRAFINEAAWTVGFGTGSTFAVNKISNLPAWCVRGGQGVDAQ